MVLSYHWEKSTNWQHPTDLEGPRECASIFLISKRIFTNLENWGISSDYKVSLHFFLFLFLFLLRSTKWVKQQQQKHLTWPNSSFKSRVQLSFQYPNLQTSKSSITCSIHSISTLPFDPMCFSLMGSQTCAPLSSSLPATLLIHIRIFSGLEYCDSHPSGLFVLCLVIIPCNCEKTWRNFPSLTLWWPSRALPPPPTSFSDN